MTEGVDFKHHMYVPEKDTAGCRATAAAEHSGLLEKDGPNYIHRRGDHCHLLKRIATHQRVPPWFNHHTLEEAFHPHDGSHRSIVVGSLAPGRDTPTYVFPEEIRWVVDPLQLHDVFCEVI
ncbi:carbohydrate binding [Branchiostoma belcheri]|nr:carbohydrate binding [Branchiostoma belcheri]